MVHCRFEIPLETDHLYFVFKLRWWRVVFLLLFLFFSVLILLPSTCYHPCRSIPPGAWEDLWIFFPSPVVDRCCLVSHARPDWGNRVSLLSWPSHSFEKDLHSGLWVESSKHACYSSAWLSNSLLSICCPWPCMRVSVSPPVIDWRFE